MRPSRYFPHPSPFPECSRETARALSTAIVSELRKETAAGPPSREDGCVYTGAAGKAYCLYRIGELDLASQLLHLSLHQGSKRRRPSDGLSLMCGEAGVAVVAALVSHASGKTETAQKMVDKFCSFAASSSGLMTSKADDEWLYGKTGFLVGALELRRVLGNQAVPSQIVESVWNGLLRKGVSTGWVFPWHGEEYVGAAHGTMGVLHALMSVPEMCLAGGAGGSGNREALEAGLRTVLGWKCPDGNFPAVVEEKSQQMSELVHFCHGAPGAVLLFSRAALLFSSQAYAREAVAAAEIVYSRGLLRKGPGLCHGVAGNGFALLVLSRLPPPLLSASESERWRSRARQFAHFISTDEFRNGSRQPDTPLSMWEGWAGVLTFLKALSPSEPDKGDNLDPFPLFSVFPV
uniref:Uncharacterized protein n=1 Tax=Chromera velia CCMP2878 TaxID=1169474 RepID=A0A0G4H5H5_9ALVE|eukprot:Cvel_5714.t1-p1 / transcript=Cvel_5714.t1 / gene=Cvel_5714 / organism=Chromera_velia_CCMP2878 / gene_product=LanC-like protein 3 homolog, putative / transcript_product=LanC-like protein 3 homolog, putative / location=Cvel_scaffold270:72533-77107(+) / protein_length=404 / sequence_SO=supercontig / SO=protein_coding / is_pseudo=false